MNPYEILFFPKADWPDPRRMQDIARLVRAGRGRLKRPANVNDDLGAVSLVLLSLVGTLLDKGVITRDDLLAHVRSVDRLEGVADGKITTDELRKALGLARPRPRRRRRH